MVKIVSRAKWHQNSSTPQWNQYTICRNGQPLTPTEQQSLFDLIQDLSKAKCHLIYRGETKSRLLNNYGLSQYDVPQPFNDMLFLYGNKGKYFLQRMSQSVREAVNSFALDDVTDTYFHVIFDMVAATLMGTYNPPVQKHVDAFKAREIAVTQFFLIPANKNTLVEAVKNLSDQQRGRVRDYYLTLLHHLDKSAYYPVSFLLSTTKNFSVAQQFCATAKLDQNELIFFGWVPRRNAAILATPRFGNGRSNLLTKLGLPAFDKSFFPKQQEISLKGGLFPHYIYGYLHTHAGKQTFEINPYIFDKLDTNWIENGLPVNQVHFWRDFNKTAFGKAFLLSEQTGIYREV